MLDFPAAVTFIQNISAIHWILPPWVYTYYRFYLGY